MSLTNLDPSSIHDALDCAWQKHLGTTDSPTKDGEYDTQGANGGLYGGLTDTAPTSLTFDMDNATVETVSVAGAPSIIDNSDSLITGWTTVTLTLNYTNSTSETHTTTNSVSLGAKFSFEVSEVVTKETSEFSVNFTFTSTDSETQTTSQSLTASMSQQVFAPDGKVYQANISGEQQTLVVPYTAVIKVTGITEAHFKNPVHGATYYNTDIGTAFGWVAAFNCAGSSSSDYVDEGGGVGYVTISGTVTMSQTVNFVVSVTDITDTYTPATTS